MGHPAQNGGGVETRICLCYCQTRSLMSSESQASTDRSGMSPNAVPPEALEAKDVDGGV